MFKLLDRIEEGVEPMLNYLEEHIVHQGLADIMASAEIITQDSEKYVEKLLNLFTKYSTLVKEAFNDDPRFLTARDKVNFPFLFYPRKICLNPFLFACKSSRIY